MVKMLVESAKIIMCAKDFKIVPKRGVKVCKMKSKDIDMCET